MVVRTSAAHPPSWRYSPHRDRPPPTFFSRHGLRSWLSKRMRMVSLPTRGTNLRFYGFFGHQSNRPASAAFRRATADHGNQTLFLALLPLFRSSPPPPLI